MSLEQELGLKKDIAFLQHRSLLNIYYTASCLKKRADEFFRPFKLTDVQFNLMMLLFYQSGKAEGLSQASLSGMMLVNRANITSLVDRMEKGGFVVRTDSPDDRRSKIVKLTAKGQKLIAKIEPLYAAEVKKTMNCLKETEQKTLVKILGNLRESIGVK